MERKKLSAKRNRRGVTVGAPNIPVDRLSGLPDEVICYILSFLSTTKSVATSILSRRWRFLWSEVPILNFNFINFTGTDDDDGLSYLDIVNKVMRLHKVQNLISFDLYCFYFGTVDSTVRWDEDRLETWINTAIARKVQNVNLILDFQVIVPRILFTCETLVHLSLNSVEIDLPEVVCLPRLKKLCLTSIQFYIGKALKHLIPGCPVLEELLIYTIASDDLLCCSISSATLKCLVLELTLDCYDLDDHDYKMEINAPALRYLKLLDWVFKHISAPTLASLIEADIQLWNDPNGKDDNVASSVNLLEFIDKLCYVKCLKLSIDYTKFLDSVFSASTISFHNLTKLEVGADWRFISKFLENADNLQVLIIRPVDNYLTCWMELQQVPTCLSSHLTTITFHYLHYTEHEFEMVRYFLMSARVLKRMEICSSYDISDCKKKDGHKRISLLERGSAVCELVSFGCITLFLAH